VATIDLSVIASAVAVGAGAYAALLRYTLKREREVMEAKIASAEEASKSAHNAMVARVQTVDADLRVAVNRIVELEKGAIRQEGALALLKQSIDAAHATLEEIKKQQVPRAEWERQMRNVETTLATILDRIDSEWKPKSS